MKVNGSGALMAYQPKSSPHGAKGASFAEQAAASALKAELDRFGMEIKDLSGNEAKEKKEKQDSWWDAWWMGGYNPHLYQQQMAAANGITFAELLAKGMQLPDDTPAEPLAALTDEQIAMLKEKYDVENMTWPSKESAALGDELFSLGVINEEQRNLFHGLVRYPGPLMPGILTPAGETPPPITMHYARQPGDSMLDIFMNELAVQRKNLDFLRSLDSPEKRGQIIGDVNMEDIFGSIETYMGQYQSAYDLLTQLM